MIGAALGALIAAQPLVSRCAAFETQDFQIFRVHPSVSEEINPLASAVSGRGMAKFARKDAYKCSVVQNVAAFEIICQTTKNSWAAPSAKIWSIYEFCQTGQMKVDGLPRSFFCEYRWPIDFYIRAFSFSVLSRHTPLTDICDNIDSMCGGIACVSVVYSHSYMETVIDYDKCFRFQRVNLHPGARSRNETFRSGIVGAVKYNILDDNTEKREYDKYKSRYIHPIGGCVLSFFLLSVGSLLAAIGVRKARQSKKYALLPFISAPFLGAAMWIFFAIVLGWQELLP